MINKISIRDSKLDNKFVDKLGYVSRNQSFEQILKDQINETKELKFSKHAKERAQERGIEVTPSLISEIEKAVDKAREKGAKDLAVIGKDQAFIVNVPNNTVITAMSYLELKNNIFTNIDSAVII
ncbi:MAG: TIGR02530 family flagellar biosynthesis protein [Proteocatella sp.]